MTRHSVAAIIAHHQTRTTGRTAQSPRPNTGQLQQRPASPQKPTETNQGANLRKGQASLDAAQRRSHHRCITVKNRRQSLTTRARRGQHIQRHRICSYGAADTEKEHKTNNKRTIHHHVQRTTSKPSVTEQLTVLLHA